MRTRISEFAALSLTLFGAALAAGTSGAAAVRPVETEHVWVVFKTHFDIGFTARVAEVLDRYRGPMVDNAMAVIAKNRTSPSGQRFSWTLPGWPLARIIDDRQTPDRRAKVIEALKEGSLAVHALPFSMHTESLDIEDLVRGLRFSSQIARDLGKPLPISAKMTDVPCHSWILPTLLCHAGIRFLHLGCNPGSNYPRVPPLFWWEGPDGSQILCAYTPNYGSPPTPGRGWPAKNYLAMIMEGDNHGPPTAEEVENVRRAIAAGLPKAKVTFGTLDDFAKAIEEEKPELKVIRGDMPDTWIHGLMSNPIESGTARNIRPLEPALETLDTQLRAWGKAPASPDKALAEAYENSLLYGEHTWGSHGIGNHYGDDWKSLLAKGHYADWLKTFEDKCDYIRKTDRIVSREISSRLDLLAASVKAEGQRIVVYNPLPWARSGLVQIPEKVDGAVKDLQSGETTWLFNSRFLAKAVPANGYKTFAVNRGTGFQPAGHSHGQDGHATSTLDTPFYRAAFDLQRGAIASLVEKASGRELIDKTSQYALGQFLHERFSRKEVDAFVAAYCRHEGDWESNDFGKNGMPGPDKSLYAAITPSHWTLAVDCNDVVDTARLVAGDVRGLAEGYTMEFTFPRHEPSVELKWSVNHKTPNPIPEGGWLCFPFAVQEPQFTLGRLGAPIDPATDIIPGTNRHLSAVSTGVAITAADKAGVALCPLDSPLVSLDRPGLWKWSMDFVPQRPTVFVNLYNNMWNTNFRFWQEGSWSERVRFWPLSKDASPVEDLAVNAWEARLPLLAATAAGPAGTLPLSQVGLALSRRGALVTAFGNDPDGNAGILLRIWEQNGRAGDLTVTLPHGLKATQAAAVNLRGEPMGKALAIVDGTFTFPLPAFAPASFLLTNR
ncbi:MAG: hypothetical protein ACLP9L_16820 [Thermoguttaceae bacterium]